MEMHQVRYFLAACETLNFTSAAKQCNVSQPSLCRAVGKLEQELGGPLFRRERSLSHLTDLGRLIRPHLENIHAASEAARDHARNFRDLETAPLELGVMCTLGPGRLIGLMKAARTEIPGLALSLHEATSKELIDRLSRGDLDVAILATPNALPERFRFQALYRERFVVAFPPGHRFERRNSVPLRGMDQESYLARLNCEQAEHVGALLADRGVSLNISYRSEREDWIQSMVLAGMGCAILPEFITLYQGLPTRVLSDPEIAREVGLATVSGRCFSPVAKAFESLVRGHDWTGST